MSGVKLRNKNCKGIRRCFLSQDVAYREMRRIRLNSNTYKCDDCGYWHIFRKNEMGTKCFNPDHATVPHVRYDDCYGETELKPAAQFVTTRMYKPGDVLSVHDADGSLVGYIIKSEVT